MSRQVLSWTHDGQTAAVLVVEPQRNVLGIRFAPVVATTSMWISGSQKLVTFGRRAFTDAGCGWVGQFQTVGTLLFGVHCFQRAITSNIREVTISWTNAVTDTARHSGAVYFNALDFGFEDGWTVLHHKRPEVDPDEKQYFPAQAQLTRRFVIYRGDNRTEAFYRLRNQTRVVDGQAGGGSIRDFGPSRIPLTRGVSDAEEARLVEIVASGKPTIAEPGAGELGFYSPSLGVWMPHGDPKAYAHGGEDIFPVPRLGSRVWHEFRSDAIAERQRAIALRPDGRPVEAREWPSTFEYRLDRGSDWVFRLPPFRGDSSGQWAERKFNAGVCAYERDIATRQNERGYSAYDPHHGCRAILDALAHYYLTGCPLNRLRVQCAAQDYMTSFRLTQVGNEDPAQGWVAHSLHQLITAARRSPHGGGRIQRELAWISWTLGHAIAITPPSDPMRARMQEWLRVFFTYLDLIRLPSGVFYAGWPMWSDDGIPWTLDSLRANGWAGRALDKSEAEMPIFQTGLLVAGIDEAAYSIGFDASEWIGTLARWVYGRPDLWVRDAYDVNGRGPFWYSRVYGPNGVNAENVEGVGNAHTIHSRDTLARAFRRTGDEQFLDLAIQVARPIARVVGEDSRATLRRVYRDSADPWSQTVKAVAA